MKAYMSTVWHVTDFSHAVQLAEVTAQMSDKITLREAERLIPEIEQDSQPLWPGVGHPQREFLAEAIGIFLNH